LDNLFFDLEHTTDNFKVQAEGVKVRIVNELVNVYKQINYEISERKEKIDHFETKLEKIIEEDVKRRLE
jgi:predicted subunit of tRNA(5-methylaminomethyl-2-thiouridylate) methyltransferase